MSIDICLATYNGALYLPELVKSIQRQSCQTWNVLFSDDGSTDGTPSLINAYCQGDPDRFINISSKEPHHSSTKNFLYALTKTQSQYVMLCDQDDVWLPFKVEKTMAKMRELEESLGTDIPLLVFTDSSVVDADLNLIHPSFVSGLSFRARTCSFSQLLVSNVVQGCTIMINRAAVNLVNKYPIPSSFSYHDHWIASLVRTFGQIYFLDESTLLYRQHANNVVGADERLPLQYKVKRGFKKMFSGHAFHDAGEQELMFAKRAADILDLGLPSDGERNRMLRDLTSFPALGPIKRLTFIRRYRLLRDVDLYGKVTQLVVLLFGDRRFLE